MSSILNDVKLQCGMTSDYTAYDAVIIMHINTVLMILKQLGIANSDFSGVTDTTQTWDDLLGDFEDVEGVVTYVGSKVRMIFDPPQASAHSKALEETIKELEWRLNVAVDPSQIGD